MAKNVKHPAAIARSLGLGPSAAAAEAVSQAQYVIKQATGQTLAPTESQITAIPGMLGAIAGAIVPGSEEIEEIYNLPAISAEAITQMKGTLPQTEPAPIPMVMPNLETLVGGGAVGGVTQMVANGLSTNGIQQANIGALVPAIGGALTELFPALAGVVGAGLGAYGLLQGLGLGEGGGLFGLNILGGDTQVLDGITLSGPGVPEPSPSITQKHWKDSWGRHYYRVYAGTSGRTKTLCYDPTSKKWWVIKKPYLAVIGKNMPRHKQLVRLRKLLSKQSADARTILKITSPTSLRVKRHRRK